GYLNSSWIPGILPLDYIALRIRPLSLMPLGLTPLGLTPLGLAPPDLAPLSLAPLGLAPLGLEPLGLTPLVSLDLIPLGKKECLKQKRTLIRKIIKYSLLFNIDIIIITRDKEIKQQKLFRLTYRDLENIKILNTSNKSVVEDLRSEFKVRRIRRALQISKVPKLSDRAK
ncbi:unnamed protein product, partial [Clonostachys chloroleuca]